MMAAAGAEALPPWKQEGYVAAAEARMRETKVTSATQIRTEERWEGRYGVQEQVTISGAAAAEIAAGAKEVKCLLIFAKAIYALCIEVLLLNTCAKCNEKACV